MGRDEGLTQWLRTFITRGKPGRGAGARGTKGDGLAARANQGESRAAAQPHTDLNEMRMENEDMNGRGTVETGRGASATDGRDRGVLGVGGAAGVGDVERGYVAPSPSLAKWVALTGGIVCAALALSLPLLGWVTP